MGQHRSIAISEKRHLASGQLLGVSITTLLRFTRRLLILLFSGFIISIFHTWRKGVCHLPTGTQSQTHTIKPLQEDQELNRATQLEDQFIAVASHELKTPMTAISGHAQLLLRRLSRMQELSSEMALIRTSIESIDGQTRRLNALVDELLDLSSIRAGKIVLHSGICNLVDLCRQVVEQQCFLTDRNIALIAPSTPVMLQADCARLNQVIINLVDNALKYSPPQSHVEVHVSRDEEVALIEVCDTGQGIPEEQKEHLFEPFYRGSYVQASSTSGLGLGLTICKEIVDRHSGRIWCESQEDIGSCFFVELPLNQL